MGLYQKMHNVMVESEGLSKEMVVGFGTNAYKAVSEAAVLNLIKPLLKKHGLILFPVKINVEDRVDNFSTSKGESSRLMTQVIASYKIVDIDTGEYEILETIGNGVDTQDKASGKALTYGYKALFQKTFCLFSGEDTDNEHSDDITSKNTKPDELKSSVKVPTIEELIKKAKSKGISEAQILATLNKDTPEKEHITDIKNLTESQIIGLNKRLDMVKK